MPWAGALASGADQNSGVAKNLKRLGVIQSGQYDYFDVQVQIFVVRDEVCPQSCNV